MASLLLRLEAHVISKGTTIIPHRWLHKFRSSYLHSGRFLSTTSRVDKGLILGVYEASAKEDPLILSKAAKYFDEKYSGKLSQQIKLFGKSFKKGKSHLLFGLCEEFPLLAVVNLGKEGQSYNELECRHEGHESVRTAVANSVLQLRNVGKDMLYVDPCGHPMAAAEGASLSLHCYDELKPKKKQKLKVDLACYTDHLKASEGTYSKEQWHLGEIYADAQNFARLLTEMPSNLLTPTKFSEMVVDKLSSYCQIQVRDQAWAEDQKMGAFLSVSQGSAEPLKFLELSYNNSPDKSSPPVVLVGKGITFDSGGISLKPPNNMDKMRGDMGGAACVVGTILGVCKLGLPIHMKALIPLCENMPGSRAVKPGDVVTAMNGKTIQVDNTDAEGRLILADALCYAETFNPKLILDMATLTGAITIALGSGAAGTYTNSPALWDLLYQAGSKTGDRLWRLPFFQHYTDQITHSQLAALNNIGKYSRAGGSCVAAAFLKEFIQSSDWIHLDISGVRMNQDEVPYLGRGMSAFDEHGPQGIPLKELRRKLLNTGITSHVSKAHFDKLLSKANANSDAYINYDEFVTLMSGEDALVSRNKIKVHGLVEAAILNIVPFQKRNDFLANYTCCPPPVFMFFITLAEIGVFIYYVFELKKTGIEVTWDTGVPICSPLIYSPYDRKEAWRFVSYMFIHQGYLHLIFNCIFQIILGIPLEFVHKFWRLFLVYMLGVLAGSMAHSITDRFSFLGGASGGCYALIGAHLAAIIVNWREMNYECWAGSFCRMLLSAPVRLIVILTLVFADTGSAIYRRYTTTGGSKVGISAHIGGMLAGLLLGVPVMKNINELPWERKLGLVTAVIYVIFSLIAVLINILYRDYPDPALNPCTI